MSYVAISTVKYPESMKQAIHEVGLSMIPLAKAQPGFVSIRFHQSTESNETMMYWEWTCKADHQACMASDDWRTIMAKSTPLFATPGVEFSLQTFDRLA